MAWLYLALIVYASLYPFTGWRIPGVSPFAFLTLPWPRWWTWFDLVSNFIGYMPFGALVFGALVRSGGSARAGFWVAAVVGTVLSFAMEFTQNFLPHRVSSNVDLGVNALGTVLGALLGLAVHVRGWVEHWQIARDRWFIGRSAGGLALLLLWPIGLLFPTPVPLGVGQVLCHAQELLAGLLEGTPAAVWMEGWFDPDPMLDPLSPFSEFSVVVLGLIAPCMVAFTVSLRGWRRLVLVTGAAALGCAATTLSTTLNFGPSHALAWSTPRVLVGIGIGCVLGALLGMMPRRAAAGLGLMALTGLVILVSQAPADPYFADSLQAWEQGRFIRFHGAAQWVGWLWPYVAITYLLARLAARDEVAPVVAPVLAVVDSAEPVAVAMPASATAGSDPSAVTANTPAAAAPGTDPKMPG
ncbi:VanZ family protein [soil metagenome]